MSLQPLLALLPLDDLPRTGWVLAGVSQAESIAGHSLGVAHVALALAPACDPPVDLGRVLAMAVAHDAPEAGSGDLPRPAARHLPAGAKRTMEAGLAEALLTGPALEAWREYDAGTTREARFVHVCDDLHLGVRLVGYVRAGARGLDEFAAGLAELDCEEFAPCAALHREILDALRDA